MWSIGQGSPWYVCMSNVVMRVSYDILLHYNAVQNKKSVSQSTECRVCADGGHHRMPICPHLLAAMTRKFADFTHFKANRNLQICGLLTDHDSY